ncbi:MBL fold metallo-hydrolase [Kitasatospora paracochleata]|uniref:L-ascorbate metabolism protein UlaG (Beta-lactamase superfamily) n=1 Tax=Kitasatospora paracochleata TaxID=58354 RepID=A0ABT1ITV7_9ACTN|nr:L-ascorbate metabolism protein UlaG (beta-lactamase superfamily) [Kitasatospora paracochleata]
MPSPVSWLYRAGGLAAEVALNIRDAKRFRTLPRETWHRVRTDAFGADPKGYRLHRVRNSPHFVDGAFRNPVPTRRLVYEKTPLEITRAQLTTARGRREPAAAIPLHRLLPMELAHPPESGLRLTWLGHATVLAELDGRRVLFDPVWSERCSPFPWTGPKRMHPMPMPLGELGPVDVVVISHDHYDHLDMDTVRALDHPGTFFAVPLGVGAHLEHWGIPTARIVELDWWESAEVADLTLTATPARHYCSRGPRTSTRYLWASWVVVGEQHRVFHSGDSGWFPGFAEIGRRFGPFDATMMQVGAYSAFWPEVHMTPEEGVRAHLELGGRVMLPIHWGTFNLAPHPWEEPAERTVRAAKALDATLVMPRPGKPFEPVDPPAVKLWWRAVAALPSGEELLVPEEFAEPATQPVDLEPADRTPADPQAAGADSGPDAAEPRPAASPPPDPNGRKSVDGGGIAV